VVTAPAPRRAAGGAAAGGGAWTGRSLTKALHAARSPRSPSCPTPRSPIQASGGWAEDGQARRVPLAEPGGSGGPGGSATSGRTCWSPRGAADISAEPDVVAVGPGGAPGDRGREAGRPVSPAWARRGPPPMGGQASYAATGTCTTRRLPVSPAPLRPVTAGGEGTCHDGYRAARVVRRHFALTWGTVQVNLLSASNGLRTTNDFAGQ